MRQTYQSPPWGRVIRSLCILQPATTGRLRELHSDRTVIHVALQRAGKVLSSAVDLSTQLDRRPFAKPGPTATALQRPTSFLHHKQAPPPRRHASATMQSSMLTCGRPLGLRAPAGSAARRSQPLCTPRAPLMLAPGRSTRLNVSANQIKPPTVDGTSRQYRRTVRRRRNWQWCRCRQAEAGPLPGTRGGTCRRRRQLAPAHPACMLTHPHRAVCHPRPAPAAPGLRLCPVDEASSGQPLPVQPRDHARVRQPRPVCVCCAVWAGATCSPHMHVHVSPLQCGSGARL